MPVLYVTHGLHTPQSTPDDAHPGLHDLNDVIASHSNFHVCRPPHPTIHNPGRHDPGRRRREPLQPANVCRCRRRRRRGPTPGGDHTFQGRRALHGGRCRGGPLPC
eukprot:86875-Chlamydomonas_euryale.AAC.1